MKRFLSLFTTALLLFLAACSGAGDQTLPGTPEGFSAPTEGAEAVRFVKTADDQAVPFSALSSTACILGYHFDLESSLDSCSVLFRGTLREILYSNDWCEYRFEVRKWLYGNGEVSEVLLRCGEMGIRTWYYGCPLYADRDYSIGKTYLIAAHRQKDYYHVDSYIYTSSCHLYVCYEDGLSLAAAENELFTALDVPKGFTAESYILHILEEKAAGNDPASQADEHGLFHRASGTASDRELWNALGDIRAAAEGCAYRNNYGGAYPEDGTLVLCTTADRILYRDLAAACEFVTVRKVEFPLWQLQETKDRISDTLEQYHRSGGGNAALSNIYSVGVDVAANRVLIELIENSPASRKAVTEALEITDLIQYAQAPGGYEDSSS